MAPVNLGLLPPNGSVELSADDGMTELRLALLWAARKVAEAEVSKDPKLSAGPSMVTLGPCPAPIPVIEPLRVGAWKDRGGAGGPRADTGGGGITEVRLALDSVGRLNDVEDMGLCWSAERNEWEFDLMGEAGIDCDDDGEAGGGSMC